MDSALEVSLGQFSDKGRKALNQDFHGAKLVKGSQRKSKGVALAMADGISSSEVSQIASETAVKTFLDDYYCTSDAWSVQGAVERVLGSINSWMYAQSMRGAARYDKDKGYVCTFSALLLKNKTAHIFHVGDTRVYRLNQQGLEQLTHDHRLWVNEDKSYLSRALGMQEHCHFDYRKLSFSAGDIFIITTDGVYEYVNTQDIINTIERYSDDLNKAAEFIVGQAFAKGSKDNLSIQLLRVDAVEVNSNAQLKQQLANLKIAGLLEDRIDFEGYRIIRKIHASSRSHVYLAKDINTSQKVVLKMPSVSSAADAQYLEQFLLEEWVARRINSAHVLKAMVADRERTYLYTVFEFVEGQTLAQWALDNPQADIETVRGIIEQIAKGLQAFHRSEMLHQDLRPENIMIDLDGTVKILDFGSVSVAGLQEAKSGTVHTYLQGTALYSAPEYFLGLPGSVKSDVFSLGVICYFLLSGRYPYGVDVAKCKSIAAQRKLSYRTVLSDESELPNWVDDAIQKAVAVQSERRYEDMFEFLHDLRKPHKGFLKKRRRPLIEQNPLLFWQGLCVVLSAVILLLVII
ncbi:MAG: bifunctional protein-serine/threonine kinase/phosphatase [Oceanospirillaceae bacterium]|nr:bifunctional protein-serine/threonine kinase/phosphatase [Oceanospirillaceae bacterium]